MKTAMEEVLVIKTEQIVKKGENMSDIDLYNLCVLNKFSEIEKKNNKHGEQS